MRHGDLLECSHPMAKSPNTHARQHDSRRAVTPHGWILHLLFAIIRPVLLCGIQTGAFVAKGIHRRIAKALLTATVVELGVRTSVELKKARKLNSDRGLLSFPQTGCVPYARINVSECSAINVPRGLVKLCDDPGEAKLLGGFKG